VRRPHKKRAVIPALISHLHTHTQYQQLFEDPYLRHTKSYYDDESLLLVQKSEDGSVFQLAMSQRVQEEVQRAKDVLPEASWELVRSAVMEAWLGDRLEWLAKAGTHALSVWSKD
jgi:cullin 4